MIQRIQSLFLLMTSAAFGLLFVWPFALSEKKDSTLFADNVYNVQDHILLIIMAFIGCLTALVAIFLFKNRKAQSKVTYFPIILSILIPVMAFVFFTNTSSTSSVQAEDIQDQAGMYLPAISLIFGLLALRFINKDDKLVKSMDRLR